MLRFHELHGATIQSLVPSFRPEDAVNDGTGVLIQYDLQSPLAADLPRATLEPARKDDRYAEVLRKCVERVLRPGSAHLYQPHTPFMEMGLGSLDLLELRHLLGEQLGREFEPTFFFEYGTPAAVVGHLSGRV